MVTGWQFAWNLSEFSSAWGWCGALHSGGKAKGTAAFKKSTWLGTSVCFMEESVKFQIPPMASVVHPLTGAKDIP